MENDSNVIDFQEQSKALKEDAGLDVVKPALKDCKHGQRTVDPILRTVKCRKCNELLDPVQVLIEIATSWGNWKVPELERQLAEYEKQERIIRCKQNVEMMTPEEKKMGAMELQAHHTKNGCPRERMWLKGKMIHCCCGWSFNKESFPALTQEVEQAHERLKVRSQMKLA
jgi:hypothetical protein